MATSITALRFLLAPIIKRMDEDVVLTISIALLAFLMTFVTDTLYRAYLIYKYRDYIFEGQDAYFEKPIKKSKK